MLLAWVNYAILQELEDAAESAPEAIKKLKRIATEVGRDKWGKRRRAEPWESSTSSQENSTSQR